MKYKYISQENALGELDVQLSTIQDKGRCANCEIKSQFNIRATIENIVDSIQGHRMQEVLSNTYGLIYAGKTRVDSVEGANK